MLITISYRASKQVWILTQHGYKENHTKNVECTNSLSILSIYKTLGGPGSSVGIATGYGLDVPGDRIPVGARFSAPVQTGPGAHPASCTMGTRSFPGVKSGRGVTLTLQPLLVPWSRKGRAIPLLPLWAVRPVESSSACTRVHLAFNTVLTNNRY